MRLAVISLIGVVLLAGCVSGRTFTKIKTGSQTESLPSGSMMDFVYELYDVSDVNEHYSVEYASLSGSDFKEVRDSFLLENYNITVKERGDLNEYFIYKGKISDKNIQGILTYRNDMMYSISNGALVKSKQVMEDLFNFYFGDLPKGREKQLVNISPNPTTVQRTFTKVGTLSRTVNFPSVMNVELTANSYSVSDVDQIYFVASAPISESDFNLIVNRAPEGSYIVTINKGNLDAFFTYSGSVSDENISGILTYYEGNFYLIDTDSSKKSRQVMEDLFDFYFKSST